ncbi:hypothetical protein [Sphingomonas sp.]|uniref:hypothetical protein n=1 Tax=Sphingomonas sp. TaxID=28214 RepID=UPI002DD61C65|nr:hypothetical protein [Sphingomonas sp.]
MKMRAAITIIGAFILTACSAAPDREERQSAETADLATADAPAAPGIAVTAAPGVAFNYRYAFRLPPARIAAAQERHAQACEKLGITRCRITGMRYTLVAGDRIDAMLAFKLDPTLARAFGREGIAAIEAAEGMLVNAEISGTDAGSAIARLSGDRTRIAEERARLDGELGKTTLNDNARAELLRQRGELDRQARSTTDAITGQQDSLATTPMTFDYESGTAIRRFDPRSPFAEAADTAVASLQWTLAVALGAVALLGPPALLIALLAFLWFRLRHRIRWPRHTPAD